MNKLAFACYLFISLGICAIDGSKAQIRCSTVEAEKIRREKFKFLPTEAEFEHWIADRIKDRRNKLIPFGTNQDGEPDLIAVVVHVIHNDEDYGEGANITDEQVLSQIEVLNQDYQRKNGDTTNTQSDFLSVASKLNIEFVLARQTVNGDPTTGIVREQGPKTSYNPLSIADRELLSSVSQWDPNLYLNIWVTNLQSPYIGLAQFPDYDLPGLAEEDHKDNEATDGMVIDYQAFGSSEKVPGLDLIPSYSLGRTSTHEIGHYLGLKHVWGDQYGSQGCTVDDYVFDTPNSNMDYSGESPQTEQFSCGSKDMFENFLNYTNDNAMNIFTVGQVTRMEVILEDAPRRATLLNAIGTRYPDDEYFDLAIQSILSPGTVECEQGTETKLEIKNNGTVPVFDFNVDIDLNGNVNSYIYDGDTIMTGELVILTLPEVTIENGSYKLLVELSNIPDDVNATNNRITKTFAVDNQNDFIPLREQFEIASLDQTNWIEINEDADIGWELRNAPSALTENTAMSMSFYDYEKPKEIDWLISPVLNFSDAVEASLAFKTSYAKNEDFNDQLRILASTDCGSNFNDIIEILYSEDLSVASTNEFWEPADQMDWKSHSVDLSKFAGEKDIRIAFQAINDYGNNLYLDDVEFFTVSTDKIVKTAQGSFTIYPNPTGDRQLKMTFNTSKRQHIDVYIYDNMGKLITMDQYPNTLNQTYYYDLTGYRSGIYIIHSKGEDFFRSKRLVIN